MRIGIDARPLSKQRAGIGTYVYNIVRWLNETDRTNEYYLFSCREVCVDFELGERWHVVVDPFKVGTLWLAAKGNGLIKKYGIDVFWGTQHVLPWGKRKGVRYVVTICDLAQFRIPDIGSRYNTVIQRVFVKGSCKRADRIIAISEATKFDIADIFGIESAKISTIYLGGARKGEPVPEEEIAGAKEKYGIKGRYFMYVSTIEPRKNVETIIAGFDRFMAEQKMAGQKEEFYLALVGGLGWKYQGVLKMIEESPYKEHIIMTGFVSQREKQALFSGAEAFVYPSLYEGFGIPLLEAMNYGLPIITSRVSSLPEVGQAAVMYLKDVRDGENMAELMAECSALTREERDEIARGDEEQRNKFSWERCAAETLKQLTEG